MVVPNPAATIADIHRGHHIADISTTETKMLPN
jgi:hypothetical protein